METVDIIDILATLWGVFTAVFGEDTTIGARAISALAILVTVTGASSYIVQGLEKLTKLTPTEKDDILLGKVKRGLAFLIALLDRIALNPDKDNARESKK